MRRRGGRARLVRRAALAGLPRGAERERTGQLAADVLTSDSRPVTPRTVRNWLRRENAPHFRYVLKVIALVGAESVFQVIDPEVQ